MSVKLVFSMYDSAADTYHLPFHALTVSSAVRSFTDAVMDSQTGISRHPEDYFLKHLGSFDDTFGVFTAVSDLPVTVCSATSVISSLSVTQEPAV